jgi:hypothetical protein
MWGVFEEEEGGLGALGVGVLAFLLAEPEGEVLGAIFAQEHDIS